MTHLSSYFVLGRCFFVSFSAVIALIFIRNFVKFVVSHEILNHN